MIEELETEYLGLVLTAFTETEALHLGQILLDLAQGLPVVINIRSAERVFFHAALPGSGPMNDAWARRKSNCALFFRLPSLLVGEKNRLKSETVARHGLSTEDYADHGGSVPIQVKGAGVVAVATVSGLPSIEDHRLVVAGLRQMMKN